MAVVHSHSHSIVPLSISVEHRLRAVLHMAGFIGTAAPLFEIRDAGGPATDLLIRSPELGRALAKSLANSNIVVMRGHGSTVTAPSCPSSSTAPSMPNSTHATSPRPCALVPSRR